MNLNFFQPFRDLTEPVLHVRFAVPRFGRNLLPGLLAPSMIGPGGGSLAPGGSTSMFNGGYGSICALPNQGLRPARSR